MSCPNPLVTNRSDKVFEVGSWVELNSSTEGCLVLDSDQYTTKVYRPKTKQTLTYYTDDLIQIEKPEIIPEFKVGQEVYNADVDSIGTIIEVYKDTVRVRLYRPTEALWEKSAIIEIEKNS